jgi:trans-aconitate methyltransferase
MKQNDEYVWSNYHQEYVGQLEEIKRDDKQDFFITAFQTDFLKDKIISFYGNLHPNWMQLYSTVYGLKPASVLEVGCGGCYHLKNIHSVLPESEINGVDLLQEQIEFGKKFSFLPESICNNLSVMNFTKEKPERRFEFVFSQAVVMHLNTENAILVLENMRQTSSKYVFLVEGINNHRNWNEMVKSVFSNEEWDFKLTYEFIDYGILLTKKQQ